MRKEKEPEDYNAYPLMVGPLNLFGLATVDMTGGGDIPMIPVKGLVNPLDDDILPRDP